jgi:hypothetical protein
MEEKASKKEARKSNVNQKEASPPRAEDRSERIIDESVEETFPASDPPAIGGVAREHARRLSESAHDEEQDKAA